MAVGVVSNGDERGSRTARPQAQIGGEAILDHGRGRNTCISDIHRFKILKCRLSNHVISTDPVMIRSSCVVMTMIA